MPDFEEFKSLMTRMINAFEVNRATPFSNSSQTPFNADGTTRQKTFQHSETAMSLMSPDMLDFMDRHNLAAVNKFSRVTIQYNFAQAHIVFDKWTILYDECASCHENVSPCFARNIRDNPDSGNAVNTVVGPYYVQRLCDIPFIGVAGYNPDGPFSVWGGWLCRNNPYLKVRRVEPLGHVFVTIIPLNFTLTFIWAHRVLACVDGGQELCRRIAMYEEERGLEPSSWYNQARSLPTVEENVNSKKIKKRRSRAKGSQKASVLQSVSPSNPPPPPSSSPFSQPPVSV